MKYIIVIFSQMQVRGSSPVTVPDNNNLYKKVRASDRDSPPPGSIPREEQRHLSRSSSHMSCEGEGHFIPEEHDVSTEGLFKPSESSSESEKDQRIYDKHRRKFWFSRLISLDVIRFMSF